MPSPYANYRGFWHAGVRWWAAPEFIDTNLFQSIRDEWTEDRLGLDEIRNSIPGRKSGLRTDKTAKQRVFIKHYFLRHRLEAIKCLFKPTRAKAEVSTNRLFQEIGIDVPYVLAMAEQKRQGLWQRSIVVMEAPPNVVTLKQWSETQGSVEASKALLATLANKIAYLHNNGVYYRDLHAANILVGCDNKPNSRVYFVDLNEVQIHCSITEKQGVDDLARLSAFITASGKARLRFLALYLRARNLPRQQWPRWLARIHQRTVAIWRRYESKHPEFTRKY